MSNTPRFLVVDGYLKAAREELAAGGAAVAGELYVDMLKQASPGSECDIVYPSDPDAGLPTGAALDSYDGIAWTGCSLTVFDDIAEVRAQIDFARACFEAGVPGFGSCWAAQIAVVAAGGKCAANPKGREMGIARKIALTPQGRAHPLYEGKAGVFDGYISHVDEITEMPEGCVHLAGNPFTNVQAVSVDYRGGKFWGLQYHPEYDLFEMARLTWCRIDKLMELGFFADRLKVHLKEKGVRHDLIDAVFALGEDDLVRALMRLEALGDFVQSDDGANLLAAHKRAANILKIEEKKDARSYDGDASEGEQAEEHALHAALNDAGSACAAALKDEDFSAAMTALAALRGPVDAFFDEVTVNCEDGGLRENRLKLLSGIRTVMGSVADFSKIEG